LNLQIETENAERRKSQEESWMIKLSGYNLTEDGLRSSRG